MGFTGTVCLRPIAKNLAFRSDIDNTPVFSSKTVSFLTLWDDVTEEPPHPKLYIYQRPISVSTCGTKDCVCSLDELHADTTDPYCFYLGMTVICNL